MSHWLLLSGDLLPEPPDFGPTCALWVPGSGAELCGGSPFSGPAWGEWRPHKGAPPGHQNNFAHPTPDLSPKDKVRETGVDKDGDFEGQRGYETGEGSWRTRVRQRHRDQG